MSNDLIHIKSADAADMLGECAIGIPMVWKSLGGKRFFQGEISTVRCYESVGLIKQVISEPGQGRVLMVDGGMSERFAIFGDRMAKLAHANGWEGLIFNAAVRDADEIATVDIGLFAVTTVPTRGSFDEKGDRNIPIQMNGIDIVPGTYAICDSDGIVICSMAEIKKHEYKGDIDE